MVRSSRTIAKNEEITVSYIDPTRSFEERQKDLFTDYAFVCQCLRCTKGFEEKGEMLTGDSILDAPIYLAKSQLHTLLDALLDESQEPSSAEVKMQEICNDASSGRSWPITFFPIPSIYVVLASRFEDEQQWKKALHCWLKIVYIIDPLIYPERLNPHRVEHLMSLCQLEGYVPLTAPLATPCLIRCFQSTAMKHNRKN